MPLEKNSTSQQLFTLTERGLSMLPVLLHIDQNN